MSDHAHFHVRSEHAEEAAQDIAADVRELGRKALRLHEAIQRGEANRDERKDYDMYMDQIRSMSAIVFEDFITGREYCVGDYVTEGMRVRAKLRRNVIAAGYLRLKKALTLH